MAVVKPLLGIDLDGVIYRWTEAAIDTLAALRGVHVPADYANVCGGSDRYDLKLLVSKDDWNWLWNNRDARRRVMGAGRPYADGIRAALELERRTRLVIMTARPANVVDVTLAWIGQQHLRPHAVIHTPGAKWEHEFAQDFMGFIDDHPKQAFGFAGAGVPVWMPARQYNAEAEGYDGIIRFTDWEDPLNWVAEQTDERDDGG